LEHACRQRCNAIQGEARRAPRGSFAARMEAGPVRRVAPCLRGRAPVAVPARLAWRVTGGPGGPAEAGRAGDQGLVAADGDIGADLEAGPARLVLDLLVGLPGPVPDAVDPHDLGRAGGRARAACLALPGWLATTTRRECWRVLRATRAPHAPAYRLDAENPRAEEIIMNGIRHIRRLAGILGGLAPDPGGAAGELPPVFPASVHIAAPIQGGNTRQSG